MPVIQSCCCPSENSRWPFLPPKIFSQTQSLSHVSAVDVTFHLRKIFDHNFYKSKNLNTEVNIDTRKKTNIFLQLPMDNAPFCKGSYRDDVSKPY